MKQLNLIKDLQKFTKIFFLFDYDGVLTPIQDNPATAHLSKKTKKLLIDIASHRNHKVAIVSGRNLKTLKRLTKLTNSKIILIGSHGLEIYYKGKVKFLSNHNLTILKKIKPNAIKIAENIAPGFTENKPYTFTYHIRSLKKFDHVKKISTSIKRFLRKKNLSNKFKIIEGKNIIELLSKEISKGKAVEKIIKPYPNYKYIYFGDDITDISAFKIMKKYNGISVSLNPDLNHKTDYLINSQKSLIKYLNKLKPGQKI